MFYFKITKTTRAVPKVTSTNYQQFGSQRHAGDRADELVGSGYYGKVIVEPISQRDYLAATRSKD